MKDEFNRKKEFDFNKKVKEFKRFEAVEYYKPKEIAPNPPEIKKYKEGFNDPLRDNKDFKKAPKNKLEKEDFNKQNNQNDSSQVQQNQSTNSQTETTNNLNQGDASMAADTGAATSSAASSTASVVSTSVSLTGGVSIISAVAIVGAGTANAIINKAPEVNLINIETGTDYLFYEFDVTKLAEDTSYIIRVYNDKQSLEFPLEQDGVQKQIVTGLKPFRNYVVSVCGLTEGFGYVEYFSTSATTQKLQEPKAVFDIDKIENEEADLFDVQYNVYISDYYETGYQTYLEVYYDDKLQLVDRVLDKDNYFRGALENIYDGVQIYMVAYTYYYEELISIGEFGYKLTYPEFIKEKVYDSTFDFKDPEISTTDTGYNLSIDTGFQSTNENESYIIDVYKTGSYQAVLNNLRLNALDSDLLFSVEGREKLINLEVPGDVTGVEIYLTPVKLLKGTKRYYDKKMIGSYSFSEAREYAKEPTATVLFDRILDQEKQEFNLDYVIQIDDAFRIGSNFRTEVYLGDQLVSEENITKKNSTGQLKDLYNGSTITVLVFTEINGDIAVIGEGEYTVEYPQGFGKFQSSFELLRENVSVDLVNQQLTVDTKFNQKDDNESYRLELYLDDELFDSVESETAVASFEGFVGTSRNFKLVFVPLSNGIEVTSISNAELDVEIEEPFEDVSISILDRTLSFSISAFDYTNTEFTARVLITFTDDNQGERTFTFTGSLNRSMPLTEYGPYVEVKSVEVEVIYNDTNMIAYYSITNDKVEYTTDGYTVSEDASISIPYEISLDSSVTFEGYYVRFNSGTLEEFDSLGKSGVIEIEELTNSNISYSGFVSYSDNGVLVTKQVKPEAIELDAVVDIESLAFLNSYNCMYFTYDVRIDDVNITKDIGLKVLYGDKDDYSGKIYSIQEYDVNTNFESGSSKYDEKIGYFYINKLLSNSGKDFLQFKTENPLFKLNQDIFTFASNSLYSRSSIVENKAGVYSEKDLNYHIYYVVEQKDGKYHYYINTNYNGKKDGQVFQRIYYSYTENGYKKYEHVDIGIETSYELILDHEVDSLYHTCVLRYVRDYYLGSELYNPIETLYEYKAIYTSFDGNKENGEKLYSYNEEDGTYQEASPQSLGLYIYNGSDYELSNALAFDNETTYYKLNVTGIGYSEIALSELELYRMEMGYEATRDTQLEYGKTYYILDQTSGEYIVATPKNLGLQVTTGVSLSDSLDTTFDTNKVYYKYDATLNRYDRSYPLMLGLYVYNDEEYLLAEDYSFDSSLTYYYFDGENYVLATPQSLGLKELNDIGYEASEDDEFRINYVTSSLIELESQNDVDALSNKQFYYSETDNNTHIVFDIDYNYFGSDNVVVNCNNQEYTIAIYNYEELLEYASVVDNTATYTATGENYQANLECTIENEKITKYTVTLLINGDQVAMPVVSPTVTYTVNPKTFTETFNVPSLIHSQKTELLKYTLNTGTPVMRDAYYSGTDEYEVSVAYDFDVTSASTIYWVIEFYADENYEDLVSTSYEQDTDADTIYHTVDTTHPCGYVKTKMYMKFGEEKLILAENELGLWKARVVESYSFEENVEVVRLNGELNTTNVRYETYIKDKTSGNLVKQSGADIEEKSFSFDITIDQNAEEYIFRIYDKNTDVLLNEYTYSPFVTLSNYQYVDGNDYITLDYNVDVPNGYTFVKLITTDDEVEYETSSGTLTITSLESNVYYREARVILLDSNNKEIEYLIQLEYEFDLEMSFDYEIVSYQSSEYGGYVQGSYAVYDKDNDKYYTYHYDADTDSYVEFKGTGDYYDENGNKAPEVDDDTVVTRTIQHAGVYAVKGNFVFKVGPLVVPYMDYTVTVMNSGENYYYPTVAKTEYETPGADLLSGIEMIFLHHGTNEFEEVEVYTTTYYQKVNCTLTYKVSYGGKEFEDTITFDPPAYRKKTSVVFNSSNLISGYDVERNNDETINLTMNLDCDIPEGTAYKLYFYDASYPNASSSELVYESELLTNSTVTINNLPDKPLSISAKLYYKNNDSYYTDIDDTPSVIGKANTSVSSMGISWNSTTSKYYLYLMLDKTKVNTEGYVTINLGGIDYEVSLQENGTVGSYTSSVTVDDNYITIKIEGASSRDALYSTVTIDETFDDGQNYYAKTYTINS